MFEKPLSPVIKVFIAYQTNGPMVTETDFLLPVQAGSEVNPLLEGATADNTGDNISDRFPYWGYLTALYWVWKNVDVDYYGFMHQNFFLNLKNETDKDFKAVRNVSSGSFKNMALTQEKLQEVASQYDLITTHAWSINLVGLPYRVMNTHQYLNHYYDEQDVSSLIRIIKEDHPDFYPFMLHAFSKKEYHPFHVFGMKKAYFQEYCEWLFAVLFKLDECISNKSKQIFFDQRFFTDVAERLLNVYMEYIKAKDVNVRLNFYGTVTGIYDIVHHDSSELIKSITDNRIKAREYISKDVVNIAFSIDNNYADYCGAAIASLVDCINPLQKIDIYILHDDSFNQNSIKHLSLLRSDNVNIIFITVNRADFAIYPLNRQDISIGTYYRLALSKLMPRAVKKLIYLDADIIVTDNIAKLWDIDIADNFLAGAPDEAGVVNNKRLRLAGDNHYINAGVCVMNIEKMRGMKLDNFFCEVFFNQIEDIALQDQDILNLSFAGKIQRLHLRWNVQTRCYLQNPMNKNYDTTERDAAASNPGILHYSAIDKPWKEVCSHPLKQLYTDYADNLPWKN